MVFYIYTHNKMANICKIIFKKTMHKSLSLLESDFLWDALVGLPTFLLETAFCSYHPPHTES